MRLSARSRGFSLIELLVGTVVGSIVLLGISMTFISQAQQYQAHASRRALQANARQSLNFMDRKVRASGYGVHPDRAVLAYDSYDVVSDSAVAGYPDAIVVHSRDPLFRRTVQAVTSAQIVLPAGITTGNEEMRRGQILLLLCPLATDFAFVTVGQYVAPNSAVIPLDQAAPAGSPNSPTRAPGGLFREQAKVDAGCFDQATLVKVNRTAFYVAMFDDDGNPATQGSTPYLMMHQGLDMPSALAVEGDGQINAEDALPVAEGIEQLQVAYILNANNPLNPAMVPPIVGVEEVPMLTPAFWGEAWQASNTDANNFVSTETPPVPWFFDDAVSAGHPLRGVNHPANIRQIRLTVVARSTLVDQSIVGDDLLNGAQGTPLSNGAIPWRQLENLDNPTPAFRPQGGGYYRVILRSSITPKNMLMNAQFPPVSFLGPSGTGGG